MRKKNSRKDLVTEEDLKPENVRIRISFMIPEDLLNMYRIEAGKLGIGYQTLMQIKLREAISSDGEVEKRLAALERKVLKHG